jgi:hypothetical protein
MKDFIEVLAERVPFDDVILTTLAEIERAGAFAYSDRSCQSLAKGNRDTKAWSPQDRRAFAEALKRRPAENIEDLLDNVRGDPSPEAEFAPRRFEYAINRIFSEYLDGHLRLDLLSRFLTLPELCSAASITFISFNYDLALEQALAEGARWRASDGYGIAFERFVTPKQAREHASQGDGAIAPLVVTPHQVERDCQPLSILLLKPHGSLDWLFPFTGNFEWQGGDPILVAEESGRPGYCQPYNLGTVLTASGPKSYAPFLVPPSRKDTVLPARKHQLDLERQAIRYATEVWVLGWSLPATDKDQEALIRDSIAQRDAGLSRVVVVNYGADAEYYSRMADVFAVRPSAIECHNDGFENFLFRLEGSPAGGEAQ